MLKTDLRSYKIKKKVYFLIAIKQHAHWQTNETLCWVYIKLNT